MYLPSPFNQSRNPPSTSIKEENQPPQNGHSGGIHRPTESKPAASSAIAASFMPNLSGASSEQPIRDPSPRHTRRESVDLINDFLKHPPRRRVMQANSPSPPPRLRRASTRALSFDILHTLFDPPTEPATPPTAKKPKVDRPCQVEQATTQTPSPTPWAPAPLQHTLPAGLGINLVALPPRHFTAASAPRDAAGRRLFSDEELRAPRPGAPAPALGGCSAGGHVGIYTPAERRERLARFHAKRQRRVWRKKIKYDCRKKLAESRPRVKGRFVRRGEGGDDAAAAGASPVGGGTSFPPSPSTGCVPVALLPAPVLPVPPPATLLGAERLGRGFLPAELASPALSTFGYQPASFLQQQAATAM
uniref:CCT domain-containing protein n=1 Tax=Heterosigma akashiwo TaxID=2829 RepID=A0A7S3UTQ9_HETAK